MENQPTTNCVYCSTALCAGCIERLRQNFYSKIEAKINAQFEAMFCDVPREPTSFPTAHKFENGYIRMNILT